MQDMTLNPGQKKHTITFGVLRCTLACVLNWVFLTVINGNGHAMNRESGKNTFLHDIADTLFNCGNVGCADRAAENVVLDLEIGIRIREDTKPYFTELT